MLFVLLELGHLGVVGLAHLVSAFIMGTLSVWLIL